MMVWSNDWAWGLPLLVATIVVHVCAMGLIATALVRLVPSSKGARALGRFVTAVALTALGAAVLHAFEAGAWASLYRSLGAMPDFRTAMLYSLGAITSYGHANLALQDQWRLLGTIEAVNGLILFGLTTAFLFAAIQQVWPVRWQAENT